MKTRKAGECRTCRKMAGGSGWLEHRVGRAMKYVLERNIKDRIRRLSGDRKWNLIA